MTKRLSVLGVLTGLVLSALGVTAPAAHAAWGEMMSIHGGKAQLCKQPLEDRRTRVRIRLDNRSARHAHLAGFSRTRDGRRANVQVRAAAGRISGVKSLVVRPGDELSVGMGETTGEGAGGGFALSDVRRC